MAHVLIATDMSANALNAAAYAIQLFGVEGNSFTLLNTFQTPPSLPDQPPPPNELTARISAEDLEVHARKLLEALPQPTPDLATVSAYGSVDMVVRDLREDAHGPDLVVMGTHSLSAPERMFLGSTTAAMIKSGVLPVLAVPAEARYAEPRRIVLADDGGPIGRSDLAVLLDIARWSRSEVMIVHVLDEKDEADTSSANDAFDQLLGAIPHTYHTVSGEDIMVALNELADQSGADMAVVVHRQRGLLDRMFHHSVATDLALHTHIPLLVLQHGQE